MFRNASARADACRRLLRGQEMMMSEETKWGPRIDRPMYGWPGGGCPIPWAKAGEYQVLIDRAWWYTPNGPSDGLNWTHVTTYRVRADLVHRVQPAAPAVVEKMAEALRSMLEPTSFTWHPDGSVSIRTTKEVLEDASATLAAYEASKEPPDADH